VGTITPKDASPVVFPVNQFIVEGRNRIGVVLHNGPVPSGLGAPWPDSPLANQYTGQAKLTLKFSKYKPEEIPFHDSPPVLLNIDWAGLAVPVPSVLEREVELPSAFGRWAWESATTFTSISGSLRGSVLEYLTFLHDLLATGQFERFIAESEIKLKELTVRAYGIEAGPFRDEMLAGLSSHLGPPYELAPLVPEEIDLRLVAGGRLIECLKRDYGYVLESNHPETKDTFFLPIMVGQREGRWNILR
jgi:hypothetical protein